MRALHEPSLFALLMAKQPGGSWGNQEASCGEPSALHTSRDDRGVSANVAVDLAELGSKLDRVESGLPPLFDRIATVERGVAEVREQLVGVRGRVAGMGAGTTSLCRGVGNTTDEVADLGARLEAIEGWFADREAHAARFRWAKRQFVRAVLEWVGLTWDASRALGILTLRQLVTALADDSAATRLPEFDAVGADFTATKARSQELLECCPDILLFAGRVPRGLVVEACPGLARITPDVVRAEFVDVEPAMEAALEFLEGNGVCVFPPLLL